MEFFKTECKHEHFPVDKEFGYCPDCGELIENQWFIVRCACCGVKHKAIVRNGKVVPIDKFCDNCGSREFVSERIDKINFIDINYAVLVKTVIKNVVEPFTQSWVDIKETNSCKPKLLQQSR